MGGLRGQWGGRTSESQEEQVLGQDGLSGEDALGLMLCVELREAKGDGESQEGRQDREEPQTTVTDRLAKPPGDGAGDLSGGGRCADCPPIRSITTHNAPVLSLPGSSDLGSTSCAPQALRCRHCRRSCEVPWTKGCCMDVGVTTSP